MKAVILAAGNGSRLFGVTTGPKCLLPIGGESLLHRQVRLLRAQGIEEVVVVVGHQAGRIRSQLNGAVTYVENRDYATTNSLYSLWLARAHLLGGCLILNGDVFFHQALLARLLTAPAGAALLMSFSGNGAEPLGAEEMKVKVDGGVVRDISKDLDPGEAHGESIGVLRFDATQAPALVAALEQLVEAGSVTDWAPRAFKAFAERQPLHVVGTAPHPWIEIDTPDDYQRAIDVMAPLMDA